MTTLKLVRYKNRKLYDATISGYVTLSKVRSLIKEGVTVECKDHHTGADITDNMLLSAVAYSANKLDRVTLTSLIKERL